MSVEFLLTSLVVVLVPGAGVIYTVTSSIGGGRQRGLYAALGCTVGILPHLVAAMLGLSGIMQIGASIFEVVRYAGAAYLVVMGVSMIRNRDFLILENPDRVIIPLGAVVRRGVLVNLLNPKLTVFFFAFLPQFLHRKPTVIDAELMALGGAFMLMTLVVFAIYAWAGAAIRHHVLGAPLIRRWLQRTMGAFFIGFAAKLAIADR